MVTMLRFLRVNKAAAVLIAVLILAGASTFSYAQNGTLRLNVFKAGFIVGVGGGSGTLTYEGNTYPLTIGGLGIGTIGLADVQLVGTATNLRGPADIAGTYGAVGAGGAFIAGAQAATLQNENGVLITLQGVEVGFDVNIGLAGMTIALQ
jgi:hypothetical protein